jgi:hypothetical protein
MNKNIAFLLILLSFSTSIFVLATNSVLGSTNNENIWVEKAPMHQARSGIGVATVNGKIYAIGGTNANMASVVGGLDRGLVGGFLSLNEQFDLSSNSWVFKKAMPTPRYDFAITAYQNKIYCIGGKIGIDKNANQYVLSGVNEVYDPATDTWETKAPMPTRRSGVDANVVNGKIYLIGGQIQSSIFDISLCNLNEVYDPAADSWTTKAEMPIPARDYASAVIGSKIYVLGGFAGSVFNCRQNQIYDTVSDDWNQGVSLPSSALYASGGVTNGEAAPKHIYVFSISGWGGRGSPVSDTQVYNLNNNSWSMGASILTPRWDFDVAVLNERFYAVGGNLNYSKIELASANEQYTPINYGTQESIDTTLPTVSVISPENGTASPDKLQLIFVTDKATSWMGYRLDNNGLVDVQGNLSLTGLSAGLHSITIYATDLSDNTALSQTTYFNVDNAPPIISVISPQNNKYGSSKIPLTFTLNEVASEIVYSLDGLDNVTISGNSTLSGLLNGEHNVTVFAWDVAGNVGSSQTANFTIVSELFPTVPIVAVSIVAVALVVAGLLIYYKKQKHSLDAV